MGYVAVRGGGKAIEESLKLLEYQRVSASSAWGTDEIEGTFPELVDQVMGEASLYAPRLAALALKQAQGSPDEAVFLLRAFRSTLERPYVSRPVDTGEMHVTRRVSAAFKDVPGGQLLGATRDYSHRLLAFDLETEGIGELAEKRAELLDAAAEYDDELMMMVLEDEEVPVDMLKAAIRKGVLANELNPVLVGSAYKNKGVQELLDAVVDYLPSPLDIPPVDGTNPDTGEEDVRKADYDEPFSALAFKIMTDPYVGKLTFFRVYSGHVDAGSYVVNATNGQRERFGRILEMNANDRIDVDGASTGDILAAVGLKNTTTGDTLCSEGHEIILESMEFPDPVIDVAVEPKTKAEQDKMSLALAKLAEEDPTFTVRTDHETGQTIIAGMGELHLEIIVDRLLREFKVEANVGKPQVAYREAPGHDVEKAEGKFVRQSGGRGQYGHAVIKLEKMEEGFGYEFVNAIVGGVVPKDYIPSIDKGIQEALETGVIAGYPVVDVKVTLFDGSYHEVDSSEAAFKIAGSMAIKDALKKSDPILLEPVMAVEVETPEQYMGDVMGNLSGRRGKIEGMDDRSGAKVIRAKVPLGEMFGYATDLRSQTQGRASYTMQFDSYEPAPKSITDEVVAKAGGNA